MNDINDYLIKIYEYIESKIENGQYIVKVDWTEIDSVELEENSLLFKISGFSQIIKDFNSIKDIKHFCKYDITIYEEIDMYELLELY